MIPVSSKLWSSLVHVLMQKNLSQNHLVWKLEWKQMNTTFPTSAVGNSTTSFTQFLFNFPKRQTQFGWYVFVVVALFTSEFHFVWPRLKAVRVLVHIGDLWVAYLLYTSRLGYVSLAAPAESNLSWYVLWHAQGHFSQAVWCRPMCSGWLIVSITRKCHGIRELSGKYHGNNLGGENCLLPSLSLGATSVL